MRLVKPIINPDSRKKGIRNADLIAYKFKPVLTKAINKRLEIAKKKQRREKMLKRQKTKAMAAKRQRTKGKISLSSEKKEN